ncbi:hypothetical protein GCK72_025931 [Caenorhabditis remanei]|uniref:ATP-dependent DNA helicase n=1 Tax=Caenorhabditis remanei TaxID=31234 RepID=A0A6A5G3S5_CAERE|nr:hypothetical protein GCK72_025931 [Caenorhabditis remanei]KAF1749463.1 hypothetical protein GCK72_025931 [Caenorhabditis remanei]
MPLTTPSVPVIVDGHKLSPEQCKIYYWVMKKMDNNNTTPIYTLVHGAAGSGKSLLLKAIRNGLQEKLGLDSCISTAPTAIASQLIGSRTIHSTFVLKWGKHRQGENIDVEDFLDEIPDYKMNILSRMRNSEVVLIDVINYVSNVDFARIDHCLQEVTGVRRPFGGLSVIVFGDFHQLPPKGDWIFEDLPESFIEKQMKVIPSSSKLWNLFKIVELPELNYRLTDETQKDVSIAMRHGDNQEGLYNYLKDICSICLDIHQTKEKIVKEFQLLSLRTGSENIAVLAPSNDIVDDINLSLVSSEHSTRRFPPVYSAGLEDCKNWNSAQQDVYVAHGSPVVCTVNYDEKIKNGAMGHVVDFNDETIIVTFSTGIIDIHRLPFKEGNQMFLQFPLRLGYAHTIERAQGATFDGIILVRNETWDREEINSWREHQDGFGEIYTAMSRARDFENCRITPMRFLGWDVSKKVEEEITRMRRDCRELMD